MIKNFFIRRIESVQKKLKYQIVFSILFISIICIIASSGFIFLDELFELENRLGVNLLRIAEVGSITIDGDQHMEILEKEDFELEEFKKIKKILKKIQVKADLTTDVYTLRKNNDSWQFITMSADEPYIANTYMPSHKSIHKKLLSVYKNGKGVYTPIYHNEGAGTWISAMAPIYDSDGIIDGILELDYEVSYYYSELQKKVTILFIISCLCIIMTIIMGGIITSRIVGPIGILTNKAKELSKGNYKVELASSYKNEIGVLAQTLEGMRKKINESMEALAEANINSVELIMEVEDQKEMLEKELSKEKFFQNITHEFRTPLTLILGPLENILMDKFGPIMDPIRNQMSLILGNTKRLLRLVNQLLDISKLNDGKMKLNIRPMEVIDMIGQHISYFKSLSYQKDIELLFKPQMDFLFTYFDCENLEKIVNNLLSNAFKFTKNNGKIEIAINSFEPVKKPYIDLLIISANIIDRNLIYEKMKNKGVIILCENLEAAAQIADTMNFKCIIFDVDSSKIEKIPKQFLKKDNDDYFIFVFNYEQAHNEKFSSEKQKNNINILKTLNNHCIVSKPLTNNFEDNVAQILNAKNDIEILKPCNEIELRFKDTGIGMNNEDLDNIFKRFKQADSSTTRENEGTGIGLSLVKELVELHKGKIHVKSEVGKGTEFIIIFPLGACNYKKEDICNVPVGKYDPYLNNLLIDKRLKDNQPGIIDVSLFKTNKQGNFIRMSDRQKLSSVENELVVFDYENKNIVAIKKAKEIVLLVDDNEGIRQHIKGCLGDVYQYLEGANGAEGIELAKENVPDLIISDIMMPKVDGYEFLQFVKKSKELKHIPFILVSAKLTDDQENNKSNIQADDHLLKPFNTEELVFRVRKLLSKRKMVKKVRNRFDNIQLNHSQLRQSEKMSFISQLVEIFLHDLINSINSILQSVQSINDDFSQLDIVNSSSKTGYGENDIYSDSKPAFVQFESNIKVIKEGSDKIYNIVHSLKNHSKQDEKIKKEVSIVDEIENVLNLLELKFMKIKITKKYSKVPKVYCNTSEIKKVIINLAINAVESIEKKKPVKPEFIIKINSNEEQIKLEFTDNGVGISDNIKPRVFEPYFTTKKIDEGSGLGLSISHRIIQDHSGFIDFITGNWGTSFIVHLPLDS